MSIRQMVPSGGNDVLAQWWGDWCSCWRRKGWRAQLGKRELHAISAFNRFVEFHGDCSLTGVHKPCHGKISAARKFVSLSCPFDGIFLFYVVWWFIGEKVLLEVCVAQELIIIWVAYLKAVIDHRGLRFLLCYRKEKRFLMKKRYIFCLHPQK